MNENLDLSKILKDVAPGTKLWSPICGECEFYTVENSKISYYPILCKAKRNDGNINFITFAINGNIEPDYEYGECLLFPSKENHDWSTFKVPKKHKKFEPFQKVLRVDNNHPDSKVWTADFYSHYEEATGKHYLTSGFIKKDEEVIPYEGNENKLGELTQC